MRDELQLPIPTDSIIKGAKVWQSTVSCCYHYFLFFLFFSFLSSLPRRKKEFFVFWTFTSYSAMNEWSLESVAMIFLINSKLDKRRKPWFSVVKGWESCRASTAIFLFFLFFLAFSLYLFSLQKEKKEEEKNHIEERMWLQEHRLNKDDFTV